MPDTPFARVRCKSALTLHWKRISIGRARRRKSGRHRQCGVTGVRALILGGGSGDGNVQGGRAACLTQRAQSLAFAGGDARDRGDRGRAGTRRTPARCWCSPARPGPRTRSAPTRPPRSQALGAAERLHGRRRPPTRRDINATNLAGYRAVVFVNSVGRRARRRQESRAADLRPERRRLRRHRRDRAARAGQRRSSTR